MNLPLGVAERHLPLALSERIAGLSGATLERALEDRTVLITGASSGIGAAAALQIGRAGGDVLLVARRADMLGDVAAQISEHGGRPSVYPADLADAGEVERLTAEVLRRHGRVDILVNNAGHSIRRSLTLSYDRIHDFELTMDLNYLAPVRLVMAFLPGMRERRFGHIVNVSSASVQVRTPRFAAYTASKAALDAFSECAAAELVGDGIRFSTISMPLVRTPMIEPTAMYANFPALSPEQAADRVCKAIIHRPRKIGTPYGALVGAIDAVDPVAMEAIRNRGYRMFPESGDAPNPAAPSPDPGRTAE
jgi:NAD(P)-dependent dehydrogenase (short-subunit alcohol dehydrogenase family)